MLMKNILFPHAFQALGWILFLPSLAVGALMYFCVLGFSGIMETIAIDLVIIGIALGALFIVCSKARVEDEMTRAIRLSSLLNSIYAYVALLIACTIFLNGVNYVMFTIGNLAIFPILFVCLFRLEMHRYYKMCDNEE